MAKNYYKILGVSKEASDDEIKKSYRKLAHKHHPDKTGGDEVKFKEINEAYQVLSDKTKRQQYDQFGQTFDQARGGGFSGFDFSGFQKGYGNFEFGSENFEDIFSDIFGGNFGGRRTRAKSGQDIQVDVEISFEEMVKGAERVFNLYKRMKCDVCQGTDGELGIKDETCSTCHGSGKIRKTSRSFFGTFSQVAACPDCEGKGKIYSKKCHQCGGDGMVKMNQEINVRVPAGIQNGQTISLSGQGEAGEAGAPSGDLFVNVHVLPHDKFKRDQDNIISSEEISFSQAVLGDKVEVETIEGGIKMKVPSGTQSGEIFRIKEKGVPHLQKRGRGDQLIKIVVKIPKNMSRGQRELVDKMKDLGM